MREDESLIESLDYEIISQDDPVALQSFLRDRNWIDEDESVSVVESAGDGNMNCTLRVFLTSEHRGAVTKIVKQARPWVAKYPTIEAPLNRSLAEAEFYRNLKDHPELASAMPRLIGSDPETYTLCLQDLNGSEDMTDAYGVAALPLKDAAAWLGKLHDVSIPGERRAGFGSRELRQLNHEHIFKIPLLEVAAIDLDAVTEGLAEIHSQLLSDESLVSTISRLATHYIGLDVWKQPGACLLHGDFYPGSFLRRNVAKDADGANFFVIDPEFCFFGPREFDLGVLLAHATFCGIDPAEAQAIILSFYGGSDQIDSDRWFAFAGIEVLRRLLGVAQLPLEADLATKASWINTAAQWIRKSRV